MTRKIENIKKLITQQLVKQFTRVTELERIYLMRVIELVS